MKQTLCEGQRWVVRLVEKINDISSIKGREVRIALIMGHGVLPFLLSKYGWIESVNVQPYRNFAS